MDNYAVVSTEYDYAAIKKLSHEKKAEIRHSSNQIMYAAMKDINRNCLIVGRELEMQFQTKVWRSPKSGITTWAEYVRDLDLGFKVQMADHYRRVAGAFTDDDLKDRNLGVGRLITLLPRLKEDGSNKQELLDMAESIPALGFVQNVRELDNKVPSDKCDHPQSHRQVWDWCTKCNSRVHSPSHAAKEEDIEDGEYETEEPPFNEDP